MRKGIKNITNSFFKKGSTKRKETLYGSRKGTIPAGIRRNAKGV